MGKAATTTRSATQSTSTADDSTSTWSPETATQISPVDLDSGGPSTSMQSCGTASRSRCCYAEFASHPDTAEEDCECSFCYRKYGEDVGKTG